jgi:hypothetical protein
MAEAPPASTAWADLARALPTLATMRSALHLVESEALPAQHLTVIPALDLPNPVIHVHVAAADWPHWLAALDVQDSGEQLNAGGVYRRCSATRGDMQILAYTVRPATDEDRERLGGAA